MFSRLCPHEYKWYALIHIISGIGSATPLKEHEQRSGYPINLAFGITGEINDFDRRQILMILRSIEWYVCTMMPKRAYLRQNSGTDRLKGETCAIPGPTRR